MKTNESAAGQTFTLHLGDCIKVLRTLPDNSVDSIVTDPPYELGFMGKSWDASGIAYSVAMWREALRVLKPGGHLLAFSGSRTYHRMACAIEDAGFEIRDQIMWIYGSGFPKSLDVSKALDKAAGAEREVIGTAADFARDGYSRRTDGTHARPTQQVAGGDRWSQPVTTPATDAARQWEGWGTALKPAHEPIVVARKPLAEKNVAANVLAHGTGAINIDACRVAGGARPLIVSDRRSGANGTFGLGLGGSLAAGDTTQGRWPANLIHDGSDEVERRFGAGRRAEDSAARFFYCAKASRKDRGEDNVHPTVKPTDLMAYLVRLVTPPGGLVLDPFMGSGSTGKACMREGFRFVGIDMTPEYVDISRSRIEAELTSIISRPLIERRKKPRAAAKSANPVSVAQIDLFENAA